MKLLIVDDEELTRTGLISSVDWNALGIEEVLQADDGLNGLEIARIYRPEIILCDVRMPRMNGITMLERLESVLPDMIPIFMSGYSDKEYLKAAIKLKAVTYIEKPINPQELTDALMEAIKLYKQKISSHRGEALRSLESASRLALALTAPYNAQDQTIPSLIRELGLPSSPSTCFTSIIVRLDSALEISSRTLEEIYHALSEFLGSYHMNCIYVAKRIQYFVYEIISADPLSEVQLGRIGDFLEEHYRNLGDYFLAAGDSFAGISRAYDSYASAVILLQSSYFFPAGTLLTSAFLNRSETGRMKKPPTSPESVFAECLSSKNEEKTISLLNDLFGFYNRNHTMLPNHVKDLYYKLFVTLENARRQQQLTDWGEAPIMATLERCFTYQELHQKLLDKTTQYFTDLKNVIPENSTIFLIRDYISKNYMNETLSVKDISAHVFLSASYLCTFFKNETGQTLNQYLTEYRMEKAKQLLSDPRYRITDISSRVGYSDGNYFGKSFKKYTGMSPSEFRERMS